MVCILAVFISSFFMQGAPRAMFVPLSLAVGFSMVASYILSSTLVPVLSVWLLSCARRLIGQARRRPAMGARRQPRVLGSSTVLRALPRRLRAAVDDGHAFPRGLVTAYLAVAAAMIWLVGSRLGPEIFPAIDTGQFRLRIAAPAGTDIDRTEQVALKALAVIKDAAGADNVQMTLGYLGTIASAYPINTVFQWMRGPEDAVMWVALKREAGIDIEQFKEALRGKLAAALPEVQFSFEPADIINEVMSFGSPTPVEVAVSGPDFSQTRPYAAKLEAELAKVSGLRNLQVAQSLDYPTIRVDVDRTKAGTMYVTPVDVSRSLAAATSSSRFIVPNFWADPKTGIGYQVQVEVPRPVVRHRAESSRSARSPTWKWFRSRTTLPERSSSATWPRSRPGRCPARSTATTCDAR